jgi:holo-[acyl-carrier protein] synthase
VGVDVVEVARVARLMEEHPLAAERLFTARELAYCRAKKRAGRHLAARFAAKEAVLKAFGTGLGPRMRWTDVEVINGVARRPHVELHGEVAASARRHGLDDIDISLTHAGGVALAHAVTVWRRGSCAFT